MVKKYLTEAEWRKLLSPEAFRVLRQTGTERPFTGIYTDTASDKNSIYVCAGCETSLFSGEFKFPSHCGWPAFAKPYSDANLVLKQDTSLGMHRIEVLCRGCDGHLGHVFDDGPSHLGGVRYCINSVALKLYKLSEEEADENKS